MSIISNGFVNLQLNIKIEKKNNKLNNIIELWQQLEKLESIMDC